MAPTTIWSIGPDGKLALNFHVGQAEAWQSTARITAVLAGTQGGKTTFEPWWLWREITRRGAGDYLAVTATYDLFKLKFLPALRECFEHILKIGRYWTGERIIELRDPATGEFWARRADDRMWGRIILRSADSHTGLESTTALAAILDEAGMATFTLDTWQAVMRRLSLSLGRVLIGTTIYDLGWMKREIYDRWLRGDTAIRIISFDSIANPSFPVAEYERARREMPPWKFNMFYRGRFAQPAGLIYDSFDPIRHVVAPFPIPPVWPHYLGVDFGGVNTAGMFYAIEPGTTQIYAYREYKAGGRTARQHAAAMLLGEPGIPQSVGGSRSEGQWRAEFGQAGLAIQAPLITDVEVGINRVYGAHARGELMVFSNLAGYLEEKQQYARELDSAGQPTEKIDAKSTYHFMDAERYIISFLRSPATVAPYTSGARPPLAGMPRLG